MKVIFEERRKCLFATHSCAHLALHPIMLSCFSPIEFHLWMPNQVYIFIFKFKWLKVYCEIYMMTLLRSLNWFYVLKCIKYFIVSAKQYIQANQIKNYQQIKFAKENVKESVQLIESIDQSINHWFEKQSLLHNEWNSLRFISNVYIIVCNIDFNR
jgi:hypothetical protein